MTEKQTGDTNSKKPMKDASGGKSGAGKSGKEGMGSEKPGDGQGYGSQKPGQPRK